MSESSDYFHDRAILKLYSTMRELADCTDYLPEVKWLHGDDASDVFAEYKNIRREIEKVLLESEMVDDKDPELRFVQDIIKEIHTLALLLMERERYISSGGNDDDDRDDLNDMPSPPQSGPPSITDRSPLPQAA